MVDDDGDIYGAMACERRLDAASSNYRHTARSHPPSFPRSLGSSAPSPLQSPTLTSHHLCRYLIHLVLQVNITITDVNDNDPVFGVDEQVIVVREDHDVTSAIYTAQASDRDSGLNGVVTYTLDDATSDVFSVNAQSGQLMLQSALDYETQQRHDVIIRAHDLGTPSRSAQLSLTVRVQDVNDNSPHFSATSYRVSVQESVDVNTIFATVSAEDADAGQNARVVYSLVPGEHSHVFGIFPDDGSIYTRQPLDRETREQYVIEVEARDEGTPPRTDTATVAISVVDTNDNAPVFLESFYSFFVQENQPNGTLVDRVSASDVDLNPAPIEYTLADNAYFAIDRHSGALTTLTSLDRELTETISVTVTATDSGSPPQSTRVDVDVHVLDVNDNSPRFSSRDYSVRIEENRPKNTLVTIISASDRDKGENASITYAFAADNAADVLERFTIVPLTGQIKLLQPLDYEERARYLIAVIARDGGVPPRESRTTVNVTVKDENDSSPEFNHTQLSLTVVENTPLYTEVGRVTAEDADRNDRIIYYVIGGNDYGTFAVNSSNGAIIVGRTVDYEESSYHTLQIRALDSNPTNPRSSIINVNIAVDDVNDNPPRFAHDLISIGLVENKPIGTTVHTYSVVDLDSGTRGQVRYEIVSQSPHNDTLFRIEEHTGALVTTREVDYEQVRQVSLVVKATDKPLDSAASLFSTVTTLVIISDKNDNAPVFQSRDRVDVMEDEPVGFPVISVIATDADSELNGRVTYLVVSGNDMGHFTLNSVTGNKRALTQDRPRQRCLQQSAFLPVGDVTVS